MRTYLLILAMMLCAISVKSQVKKAAISKPSKAFTIKYLSEKLNQNCVGESKIENETWWKSGEPGLQYYRSANYQSYLVEEINGVAYIIIHEKYRVKQYDFDTKELKDIYSSNTIKIPINKIAEILIFDVPKKEKNGAISKTYEGYRGIFFTTAGDDITYYNGNKDIASHTRVFDIPSFNADFELSFKKGIMNLQGFYKINNDPFGN